MWKNTITIAEGGSSGYVSFLESEFWLGSHAYSIVPKKEIISEFKLKYNVFNKFLFYFLKMNQLNLQNMKVGVGIPSLHKNNLNNLKILIPPLELQNKIVDILDKFQDAIENSKGLLPQEIELRKTQYEYYRDKLLSFDIDVTPERERERERAKFNSNT
ncbi:restriction endonuclease subunit S [Mesomycoplasma lagogenitalium]|uniref:Restriction endonuclease subunit S n=1 Tax=Mesomycoplasma lagogenitalium TaxID=171286 RepID=A0ABY8LT57_9BACT|nr:restriction endonuclease subunit S [Mesomycoplasma lagogenitalium]WGI36429.1 restriction endonuclease subunit S [Mesomycoplasma lagogenitalium]